MSMIQRYAYVLLIESSKSTFSPWFTNNKLRPGLCVPEPVILPGRLVASVKVRSLGSIKAVSLANHLLLHENEFTGTFSAFFVVCSRPSGTQASKKLVPYQLTFVLESLVCPYPADYGVGISIALTEFYKKRDKRSRGLNLAFLLLGPLNTSV